MLEHPDYRTLGLEPADLDHRAHFERKSARIALWPREDGPEKTAMEPRLPIPRDPEPGPDDRLADRVVRTVVGLVKTEL